jgi:hypothetical protein
MESKTQYITSEKYKSNGKVICDTPGFDDTRTPEIEITNSIGIINAIRKCKTAKVILLINYA